MGGEYTHTYVMHEELCILTWNSYSMCGTTSKGELVIEWLHVVIFLAVEYKNITCFPQTIHKDAYALYSLFIPVAKQLK